MIGMMRNSAFALLGCLPGACVHGPAPAARNEPVSERVLAARRLQAPLSQHLCQAAVYPVQPPSVHASRVTALAGRGKNFPEALEALCREADGLKVPAIVDIYYWRNPGGWSDTHEVRGVAIRFEEGTAAPAPPKFADIQPPKMPDLREEPPPASEKP